MKRFAYSGAIEVEVAPELTTGLRSSTPLVPLALVELVRELQDLAQRDARFDRAASMASELQEELERLSVLSIHNGSRRPRRPLVRANARRSQAQARAIESLEASVLSLHETVDQLDVDGVSIRSTQLADLRLGERTRRVFHDAGLLIVQDVIELDDEHAADIVRLAPTSLAELRAALMFAVDASGRSRPALPAPEPAGDVFEGVATGLLQLPGRQREAVVLLNGIGDRVHDPDEVAQVVGVAPEQVALLQRRALNALLSQPAAVEACWRLEDLCAELGLGWHDERLPTAIAAKYPNTRVSFTRLVTWLMREKGRMTAEAAGREFLAPSGIAHFEEMVVATLGRYGNLSESALSNHVRAALSPENHTVYPELDVGQRVRAMGPIVHVVDGVYQLPREPIPGMDDRHIRALNGLIGALQRVGTGRIASLTVEINKRLPRTYHVSEQFVKTWLTRHPELFVRADADRFKLATLDVDILCGLATSWLPNDGAPAPAMRRRGVWTERLHNRVIAEIRELLEREGPLPIARIRSYLYGRFNASADAVIAQNPHDFVRAPDGMVSLNSGETDVIIAEVPNRSARTPFGRGA